MWLGLPGCLEKFDQLARAVTGGSLSIDAAIESAAVEAAALTSDTEKKSAEMYTRIFEKVCLSAFLHLNFIVVVVSLFRG